MKSFATVAAVALAGALAITAPAVAQSVAERHTVQGATLDARLAIGNVFDAQSRFNVARSEGDQATMELAANKMLLALQASSQAVAILDELVDSTAYNERLDTEVKDLLVLVTRGEVVVSEHVETGDMAALGTGLDNSADWFTGILIDGRRVLDEVTTYRTE
ncbi:MAG: hypothetical protein ACFBRM_14250 [Pikeienuella sp.]